MVIYFYLYGLSVLTLILCVLAARHDVRSLTIHNGTVVSIALIFCVAYGVNSYAINSGMIENSLFDDFSKHLYSSLLMLAICFGLFWFGILGGGDAKMMAALSLWAPLSGLSGFVMAMALVGGILGLSALILKNKEFLKPSNEEGWIAALKRGESTVPYGIALAAAAIFSFIKLGYVGV